MRQFTLGTVAALFAAAAFAGPAASPLSAQFSGAELRDLDLSRQGPVTTSYATRQALQAQRSRFGFASQHDERLGTTFLWASRDNNRSTLRSALNGEARQEAEARDFLSRNASLLGVSQQTLAQAKLHDRQVTEEGPVLHRFRQQHAGLEVYGRELNVLTDKTGRLVAISGYFAPRTEGVGARAADFSLSPDKAIAKAFKDMGGHTDGGFSAGQVKGAYQSFTRPAGQGDLQLRSDPRVKKVMFPLPGALTPAYYIELSAKTRDGGRQADFGYVVSATTGQVLFRKNQMDHEDAGFSYRVLASPNSGTPYDSPMGNGYLPFRQNGPNDPDPRKNARSNLNTVNSLQARKFNDPWLPPEATTTTGNNVDAYLDLTDPDGYNAGDLRPALTSPKTFDYPVSGDADPHSAAGQNAAAVNLFYLNNYLHDSWYTRGFDEAAGNAQQVNYGRGGVEGDPIHAEGQDVGGRNNANMSTPSDGFSPRMQMYLWDGLRDADVDITAPAELAGPLQFSLAAFGPTSFELTREVVLSIDSGGTSTSDGCEAITNDVVNKLALIDRGNCAFVVKVKNAQNAGAAGVVVANNVAGSTITMGGTDATITIPSVMVTQADGVRIKTAGSTVSMHLRRALAQDLDGTIDAGIVAHEFFHYVSNRLVGNAGGLSNNQGRSMGEGWSDFAALIMSVRHSDLTAPNNDHWQGAYSVGGYLLANNYFGIRRTPYSTDFAKNPLTFKHIQNGVALPNTAPIAFGQDGSNNAEVHNSGEIWTNVLWEAYAGFLQDGRYSFHQARVKMQNYVIAGLKMTPNAPTMLEARDAILAVADAADDQDFTVLATAFAKRGMGLGAVGPARNSNTHIGVTESYVVATPTP
jgi:large repetitive protein